MHTPFYDEFTGKVVMVLNAMDTPGIDPTLVEPVEALQHTSLRYRVSSDGGQTYVFDEPVIVEGRSQSSPAPDVVIGHNAIFMGDGGSQLLRTRGGTVLVPAVMTLADEGGALVNPGGGGTWTDVAMVRGVWSADGHLRWTDVARVSIDPRRSTRGLDEPTLAELSDGRIVAVMRGSNGGALDPDFAIPGRRWVSLSTDDGRTWDEPRPLTVDGAPCFSPSSMSHLLRHSSGRLFWIGNLSAENPRGNSPRWPLVIAEVDERAVTLIGSTITIVDTLRPEDGDGIELSPHGPAIEDRITSDILIPMLRFRAGYTSWLPVLYRLSVDRG